MARLGLMRGLAAGRAPAARLAAGRVPAARLAAGRVPAARLAAGRAPAARGLLAGRAGLLGNRFGLR